jgi:hypothetical protein
MTLDGKASGNVVHFAPLIMQVRKGIGANNDSIKIKKLE